ncbi:DUF1214 domain-containing protein [Bacillus sp. OTU2372]|uniref:DUF1214 domain-containing protein n=1 Tax=Bacillus sp. OTU2372 TaxID=3043858 RepID=UPI00406C41C0
MTNAVLGGLPKEEATYAVTYGDRSKTQLNGQNKYVIHFNNEELPKVREFWSITLYGMDHFFVENPINRYKIGSLTEGLKFNADGSLDIYIQHEAPVGHESNWLPASEGDFYLMMRFYNGEKEILDRTYTIPPFKKVN